MNNTKVSVLIAVYNAEAYLRICLDSLLHQTYNNIEVLCVDDCSTDASWEILQEYANKDNRFSVWKQNKNRGQAKARNIALSHSTGDIVMFLDSDDWLEVNAIAKLVDCFTNNENTDCVLFNLRYVYPDGTEEGYRSSAFEVLDGRDAFIKSLTWDVHGVYAIRGELHRKLPYDDSCRHYSDDNTTRIHFYFSREVRCCDAKYYYRQHNASVSHNASMLQLDYLRANESMKCKLLDLHCDEDILSLYENERWKNLIGVNLFFANHKDEFSKAELRIVKKEIKRIWEGIEVKRLFPTNKYKFGFYPFKNLWTLFCIEQSVYCKLRILLKQDLK